MMTIDAPFHKLPGIGSATEAKLHEAGIRTWAGLAVVLDALARVRDVDAKHLRDIRDLAQARADDAAAEGMVNGERSVQYIVRVVTHPDGSAARCIVVDIRTGLEKAFAGISGGDIARFIEASLVDDVAAVSEPPATTSPESPTPPSPPPPAESDDIIRFSGSSVDGDIVILDAGKAIGGSRAPIRRRWDTSGIQSGESGSFAFRASLAARPYGTGRPADWRPIGLVTGQARPREPVELAFPADSLASGINRLDLTIELNDPATTATGPRRVGGVTPAG